MLPHHEERIAKKLAKLDRWDMLVMRATVWRIQHKRYWKIYHAIVPGPARLLFKLSVGLLCALPFAPYDNRAFAMIFAFAALFALATFRPTSEADTNLYLEMKKKKKYNDLIKFL